MAGCFWRYGQRIFIGCCLIIILCHLTTKNKGLGGGDIKFITVAGFFLGTDTLVLLISLSCPFMLFLIPFHQKQKNNPFWNGALWQFYAHFML